MNASFIPKPTLGRIPVYIQYLKDLPDDGTTTISATKIARGLSLGEVQVRKDLALISGQGKPKIGYERIKLMHDLEYHLGYENLTNAVLVGAGKIGRALLDYDGFEEFGIRILAGFDCNDKVISISNNKTVLPIKEIEEYCAAHSVRIGIITVGQGSAQEVCDRLVGCGIKAIWNFTPFRIRVPEDIVVQNTSLYAHLAVMFNRLNFNKDK